MCGQFPFADKDETEVEPELGHADPSTGAPQLDDSSVAEPVFGEDASLEEVAPVDNAATDDDDEPIETFADWNVPSWQEIVGSLYRPER